MANGISDLTASTFDESIQSAQTPVVVDFWAEWCGPCKKVTPILEEISDEYGDQIQISKLNVDDHPTIAQRYNVMSIPTLLVFQDGELAHKIVGAKAKAALLEEFSPFLRSH